MSLGFRDVDLEAGLDIDPDATEERSKKFVLGGNGSSISGKCLGRFNQETADEARPLLQKYLENIEDREHLTLLGVKPMMDKHKKVNDKRPPKPPRPPKGPSLDAADLKLIRELSELALEKRLRVERMKGLKKMRASKAASLNSSYSTLVGLIITVLFCLIILVQGMCARSGSVISFHSFPGPVVSPSTEDLISIQVFKNLAHDDGNGLSSKTDWSSTPTTDKGLTREAG